MCAWFTNQDFIYLLGFPWIIATVVIIGSILELIDNLAGDYFAPVSVAIEYMIIFGPLIINALLLYILGCFLDGADNTARHVASAEIKEEHIVQ